MQVVAFTGMPGAGKSEAVEVARRRGLPIVRMGDFVWEETRRKGLALTDVNVGSVATQMRKEKGPDVWAQRTCDHVLAKYGDAPLVVVDGVRTLDEVRTFRERLGAAFHLVAIQASPEDRVRRLLARGRTDDNLDPVAIQRRDERERSWGIEKTIDMADESLVNHRPLKEFQARVGEILDRLTRAEAGSSSARRPGA